MVKILSLRAEQNQHHIDRHEQERSCLAWAPVMAMLRRPSSAPNKRWPPLSSLFLHSFVFVFGHHRFRLCYFGTSFAGLSSGERQLNPARGSGRRDCRVWGKQAQHQHRGDEVDFGVDVDIYNFVVMTMLTSNGFGCFNY